MTRLRTSKLRSQNGTQGKVTNGTQAGAPKSRDRKGKTVIKNSDERIGPMIAVRPKITAGISSTFRPGARTTKRHIAQMPRIKYADGGYTGHREATNKEKKND